MVCIRSLLTGFLRVTVVLFVILPDGGCSVYDKVDMLSRQNTVLLQKNEKLSASLEECNILVASLQMKLVRKQEEINQLKLTQQSLTREVVQKTIRLPASSTKVDTVTFLAEVETNIATAREAGTPEDEELFAHANSLVRAAGEQLEKSNYEEASTLAAQALEQIETLRLRHTADKLLYTMPYADFIKPLALRLVKRANVRKRPGIQSILVDTLEPGTFVTAVGHQGNWIKVSLDEERVGWIYCSLLSIPEYPDYP